MSYNNVSCHVVVVTSSVGPHGAFTSSSSSISTVLNRFQSTSLATDQGTYHLSRRLHNGRTVHIGKCAGTRHGLLSTYYFGPSELNTQKPWLGRPAARHFPQHPALETKRSKCKRQALGWRTVGGWWGSNKWWLLVESLGARRATFFPRASMSMLWDGVCLFWSIQLN